jgi:hypothetical protein
VNYVEADVTSTEPNIDQIEISEASTSTIEQFDVVQSTQPEQTTT